MRNQNQDLIPAIDAASQKDVEDIIQALEDRAIGAGAATRDGLRDLLANELERIIGNVRRVDDAPEEQHQGQQENCASQVFHCKVGLIGFHKTISFLLVRLVQHSDVGCWRIQSIT
jgi:hypothetical protein